MKFLSSNLSVAMDNGSYLFLATDNVRYSTFRHVADGCVVRSYDDGNSESSFYSWLVDTQEGTIEGERERERERERE